LGDRLTSRLAGKHTMWIVRPSGPWGWRDSPPGSGSVDTGAADAAEAICCDSAVTARSNTVGGGSIQTPSSFAPSGTFASSVANI